MSRSSQIAQAIDALVGDPAEDSSVAHENGAIPDTRSETSPTSFSRKRRTRDHESADRLGRPFYGIGRGLQTSVALNPDQASRLEGLVRAARVPSSVIFIAALQHGLPMDARQARRAIVEERVARAGARDRRIEHNFRLPQQLRDRVDELVADSRLQRARRADLVNAALTAGLPTDPEGALNLIAEHAKRVELAAAEQTGD